MIPKGWPYVMIGLVTRSFGRGWNSNRVPWCIVQWTQGSTYMAYSVCHSGVVQDTRTALGNSNQWAKKIQSFSQAVLGSPKWQIRVDKIVLKNVVFVGLTSTFVWLNEDFSSWFWCMKVKTCVWNFLESAKSAVSHLTQKRKRRLKKRKRRLKYFSKVSVTNDVLYTFFCVCAELAARKRRWYF